MAPKRVGDKNTQNKKKSNPCGFIYFIVICGGIGGIISATQDDGGESEELTLEEQLKIQLVDLLKKISQGRHNLAEVRLWSSGGLVLGSFSILFCLRILIVHPKTRKDIAELTKENLKKRLEQIRKKAVAEALEIIREKEEKKELQNADEKSEGETIESVVSDSDDESEKTVVELSKDDLAERNYTIENSVVYITNNGHSRSVSPVPSIRPQHRSFSYNVPAHLEPEQDEDINQMLVYKLRK